MFCVAEKRHERFTTRVLSARERRVVGDDPLRLWLHWTAKEAAFKALKRLDPSLIFSPKQFEYDPLYLTVMHGEIRLLCRHLICEDFIYSVCTNSEEVLSGARLHSWIGTVGRLNESPHEVPPTTASIAVRELATAQIAKVLGRPCETLAIRRSSHAPRASQSGIPELYIAGESTAHKLSFTHDGRFVACLFFDSRPDPVPLQAEEGPQLALRA